MDCKKCDKITAFGKSCKRCRATSSKYCWQHQPSRDGHDNIDDIVHRFGKLSLSNSVAKKVKYRESPPKVKGFRKNEVLRFHEDELIANAEAYKRIRRKAKKITNNEVLYSCINDIFSFYEVWDQSDLDNLRIALTPYEINLIQSCLAVHNKRQISKDAANRILKFSDDRANLAHAYRKAVMKY